MPWKECKPMDERLRFIARLLEGEKMAPLCREFGISRVTGYKIYNRYKDTGLDGLNDRCHSSTMGRSIDTIGFVGQPK
jgi:transposase